MNMRYFLVVLLAVCWLDSFSQAINNLYVNSTENILRLDFSSIPPQVSYLGLGSGANIGEGIAHIENEKGEAIILVNSSGIYDKDGILMPGSQGILAHPSSTEIVICKKPQSANLFFVIYNSQLCSRLYYSIIDLSLRSGMGDVTLLNGVLDSGHDYAEGLEIIAKPCSNDLHLLAYQCQSGFVRFDITTTGFSLPRTVTTVDLGDFGGRGELDYRRGKIGYAITFSNKAYLADFSEDTGTMTGGHLVSVPSTNGVYGLEFTADASCVYFTDLDNRDFFGQVSSPNLFRYRFQDESMMSWTLSNQSPCVGASPQGLGQIEIGKDLRLYVPVVGGCILYIIEDPALNPTIKALETNSVLSAGVSDHIKSEFLDEFVITDPIVEASKKDLVLCPDKTISLSTDPSMGFLYQWYHDGSPIAGGTSAVLNASETGAYFLKVTDINGCSKASTVINLTYTTLGEPELGSDTILCNSDPLVLISTNDEDADVLWGDGDQMRTKIVASTGTYHVTVSKNGCVKMDTVDIQVFDLSINPLPNVITPNGNETNEYFIIPWETELPVKLQVMNRWGKEVYQNINYKNEWNAPELPPGVYYYCLTSQLTCLNLKGWLQVLR
jgi:hypothetical protein